MGGRRLRERTKDSLWQTRIDHRDFTHLKGGKGEENNTADRKKGLIPAQGEVGEEPETENLRERKDHWSAKSHSITPVKAE